MPRRLVHLALACGAILVARPAAAEVSILLQRGVSGFGGAFTFSAYNDMLGLSLGGGYSYKGVVEMDLSVSRFFPNGGIFGGRSVDIWEIDPSIEVHPLKQSTSIPISLGISAGLSFPLYSSDSFDAQGISVSAFGYSFALSAYRFFRLSESVAVVPAVSLQFTHVDVSVKTPLQQIDTGDSTPGGALGAYFVFIDSGGRIWGLVPTVGITEHDVNYHFGFASVFSMP